MTALMPLPQAQEIHTGMLHYPRETIRLFAEGRVCVARDAIGNMKGTWLCFVMIEILAAYVQV